MFSVFDTTDSVIGLDVKSRGYDAVIKYAESSPNFPDKTFTPAEIEHLRGQGVGVGLIFETGDTIAHFGSASQGATDAKVIVARARKLGFPGGRGLGLFWAADFDATEDQIRGPIAAYAKQFRAVVEDAGFSPGAYCNGLGLRLLGGEGVVHYNWLPQSTGWGEYDAYFASRQWHIHQLMNVPLHLSADGDNCTSVAWAWMPGTAR